MEVSNIHVRDFRRRPVSEAAQLRKRIGSAFSQQYQLIYFCYKDKAAHSDLCVITCCTSNFFIAGTIIAKRTVQAACYRVTCLFSFVGD